MNPRSLVTAKSVAKGLQDICDKKGITPYELSLQTGIDKSTIYRIFKQEWTQIKIVVAIANALNLQYKIDEERNVTFITAADAGNSYQESHRNDLKQQLTEILNNLNEDSLENLLEILISMKEQGKFNHADSRKNYQPIER